MTEPDAPPKMASVAPPLQQVEQNDQRMVAAELERLLGVGLRTELCPTSDARTFFERVGARIDVLGGAAAELVAFLAPDPLHDGASLAEAVAEILLLPRRDRTEYRDGRLASPPWDIRRLLVEYALWAQRLDDTVVSLTSQYCATRCDRLPRGCCSIPGYDMGMVPDALLDAQQLEARLVGHALPEHEVGCKYHTPRGCTLRRFKSPACIGMLCAPLVANLRQRSRPSRIEALLVPLARFRNHYFDREQGFTLMRDIVVAAERLQL